MMNPIPPEGVLASLVVTPLSELHIGSGASRPGIADFLVAQDDEGMPYIPATHLRNNIRWWAEGLLEHSARGLCADDTGIPCVGRGVAPCVACRAFGAPGVASWLVFSDATVHPVMAALQRSLEPWELADSRSSLLGVRTHVKLDRVTGSQQSGHLFSNEVVAAGIPFVAQVSAALNAVDSDRLIEAVDLVWLGSQLVPALGKRRRRGYGEVTVTFEPSAQLVGAGWTVDSAADRVRKWYA